RRQQGHGQPLRARRNAIQPAIPVSSCRTQPPPLQCSRSATEPRECNFGRISSLDAKSMAKSNGYYRGIKPQSLDHPWLPTLRLQPMLAETVRGASPAKRVGPFRLSVHEVATEPCGQNCHVGQEHTPQTNHWHGPKLGNQ